MKHAASLFIALALTLAASGSRLAAQAPVSSPAHLGIMGGATYPRGSDFTALSKSGWNAGALLSLGVPLFPLSFRIDAQWHQLPGKTVAVPDIGSNRTDLRIIDGTANFVWTFGAPATSNFYLIGGAGLYKLRARDFQTPGNVSGGSSTTIITNATEFGWNGGAGVQFQLGRHSLFIEGRYHAIRHGHEVDNGGTGSSKTLHLIPISVGITL